MALGDIKTFFVIHANIAQTPNDAQWQDLFTATKDEPFCAAVIQAARAAQNYITHDKRSRGVGNVNKYTLVSFTLDVEFRDALVAVLNTQAAAYSVTGTLDQKFRGVLQYEFRQGAMQPPNNYSAAIANNLLVPTSFRNQQNESVQVANDLVIAYLQANSAIWYAAE